MTIPAGASIVSLPDMGEPYPTLLDFLVGRFPYIPAKTWLARMMTGKILNEQGNPITQETPYLPNQRLFYFREVTREPPIPFKEQVLFDNDHFMVVCKPHFLPVIPGGPYVKETLITRLQLKTGNDQLSPINRIDRGTAGLVLISANKETRGRYQQLFMTGQVRKTYEAVVHFPADNREKKWLVENRIEQGTPWFRMQRGKGEINARSRIELLESKGKKARFRLFPLTGKKHQLRIHLSGLGFPIVNDRYYPELLPEIEDDFNQPLQLLSQEIAFKDPLTDREVTFRTEKTLVLEPTNRH